MDNDLLKHAPGLAGVGLAALAKLKEGWRVMVTQAAAGVGVVLALRGFTEWLARKVDMPTDAVGFLIGGLGVSVFNKLADTVQQLELAKPINSFIERWTGAKAPPAQPPQGGQP